MIIAKAISVYLRIIIPFIVIWLFSINIIWAQQLGFKRYTVEDGLTQSEVISLFQDSRGFLWVGTKFGVSRFDGNQFVTKFDSCGILKSSIRFINEISNNSVVVSSTSGFVLFMPDGQMVAYKYPVFNSISSYLYWSSNGRAYVAFVQQSGIRIYELTQKGAVEVSGSFLSLIAALKKYNVKSLIHDDLYHCFYFTDFDQRVYCFDSNRVTKFPIPFGQSFTKGQDGQIYILTTIDGNNESNNYQYTYNTSSQFDRVGTNHILVRLKRNISKEVLYFKTEDPCALSYCVVKKSGDIIVPQPSVDKISFFNINYDVTQAKISLDGMSAFFIDDENTIWAGTVNGLLHVFPNCFINYSSDEGLLPNTQTVVADKDDLIWVGSREKGLQYYKNGKFYSKKLPTSPKSKSKILFYPGGRMDHLGRIHFGISPFFLMHLENDRLNIQKKWPIGGVVYSYDDTVAKKYFYGSSAGLVEQGYDNDYFKIHPVFPGSINARSIVSIVRANNGKLLLGGFKWLFLYDGHYFEKLPNAKFPDIPGANAMEKDALGNIWIGNGNGLYLYNNKSFAKIKNDHFNDLISSLHCLDSNRLLIGGLRGIGILDLKTFYTTGQANIRYFDKSNGFIGGECQQNCITRDTKGDLWIGGSNRLVKLDVSAIPECVCSPRIYITEIFTNKNRKDWSVLSAADFAKGKIVLTHSTNNIRFSFTGIYFTAPENLSFTYKLEGFDKYWSSPDPDCQSTYTNLPPGKYRFLVKVQSDSGASSTQEASFDIVVKAVFWQTWYFYFFTILFLVVVIAVGISQYFARRTRLMRKQIEDDRRFAELQFKTLRNQLAPHFVFNALNAIGSSIYQNDNEKSYDFLQRFATLIRSTLVNADKTYRTLNEEVEFVKNYLALEQFRFENKFAFKFNILEGVNPNILVPKMIIQTFAENSVKHGLVQKKGNGLLTISIKGDESNLSIIVSDNGIGRVESMKNNMNSTGKGMEIINEFITLFNKFNENKIFFEVLDITDDSGKITGTQVNIKLPTKFTYNSTTKEHESF